MDSIELIYTDKNRFELGIIDTFEGDFDTTDTKDFEITIHDPLIPLDGYVFVDGEEYGGKVIGRVVDSKEYTYTYTCRNFRGMLDKKVLYTSRTLQGNITDVINDLLIECDVDDMFVCDEAILESVDADVKGFQVRHFSSLYPTLMALADECNAKLIFSYVAEDGICHITPTQVENFSDYLNYTRDNTANFTIEDQTGNVNHLVCTGVETIEKENEQPVSKRYTIHLFTDSEGVVQQFTKIEKAMRDSHYILDRSKQVLKGMDEVVEVLNVDSITTEYDYVRLTSRPSDWDKNYKSYFTIEVDDNDEAVLDSDGNVNYVSVSPGTKAVYSLAKNRVFEDDGVTDVTYYEENTAVEEGYSEANIISTHTVYKKAPFKKAPKDWDKHYDQFYVKKSDGTSTIYENVSGESFDTYPLMTKKPSDWAKNFGSYYVKNTGYKKNEAWFKKHYKDKTNKNKWKEYYKLRKSEFVPVTGVTHNVYKTETVITKSGKMVQKKGKATKKTVAPKWKKNTYHKKVTKEKAPKFNDVKPVFLPKDEVTEVRFVPNTYYVRNDVDVAPKWQADKYYRGYPDHYFNMVRDGLAYLLENRNQQIKKVTLDELQVSIGDIVGGTEETTGIEITTDNDVKNIVVKISNGIELETEYTIGGSDETEVEKGKYKLWNNSTYWDEPEKEEEEYVD